MSRFERGQRLGQQPGLPPTTRPGDQDHRRLRLVDTDYLTEVTQL
jgi:hypothetical protein